MSNEGIIFYFSFNLLIEVVNILIIIHSLLSDFEILILTLTPIFSLFLSNKEFHWL
jgi:hypothetical protein